MRKMPCDSKKSRRQISVWIFAIAIFCFGMSHYAVILSIAALFPDHCDITRFHLWPPIATGKNLDRTEKIPSFVQTTGTVDVFVPLSGISGHT